GGDLAFEGGSQGEGQRFSGQGTATADALRNAAELGVIARLGIVANGQAAYRGTLAFVGGQPQMTITSNLVGLGIDLPAPMGKAAATPMPLRVQTTLDDASAAGSASRETLQVDLGS